MKNCAEKDATHSTPSASQVRRGAGPISLSAYRDERRHLRRAFKPSGPTSSNASAKPSKGERAREAEPVLRAGEPAWWLAGVVAALMLTAIGGLYYLSFSATSAIKSSATFGLLR